MKLAGLLAAVAGLVVALAFFVGTQLVVARVAAANAADAAALAAAPVTFRPFGASGGARSEAARLAAANGATLVRCRCRPDPSFDPRTVEVTVIVSRRLPILGSHSVSATGRARFEPARLLGPPAPVGPWLP